MKVLWICNIMLPVIAGYLGREASNKEGWLSGLADILLERGRENGIELAVAFPTDKQLDGYRETITVGQAKLQCFGFYEDIAHADSSDPGTEQRLRQIMEAFEPDVVHCFGTEYGHTSAALQAAPEQQRVLVGIQGMCSLLSPTYMASLPQKVRRSVTFRDWLKQDSIRQQQEKYRIRGERERACLALAPNITGRTDWDRYYAGLWNPAARYYSMNETLRPQFYTGKWSYTGCEPGRIFLSQGDYPVKGLHFMLLALAGLQKDFPEVRICVAGNSLVADKTWKDRLKRSAYGQYLLKIIKEHHLEARVEFLGRLSAEQMKEQYLKANVFVCCSVIENSPNSLGEAMLLGVPCVTADVGGIPTLFEDGVDGIMYSGYRVPENVFHHGKVDPVQKESEPEELTKQLQTAVSKMLEDPAAAAEYGANAAAHARRTHSREKNYQRLLEIYTQIARR